MKEAGVVPKESVKEGRLKTIREFADRFLNAESAADDIAAYKRKLDEIINDVRVGTMKGRLSGANVIIRRS